MKPLAVLALLVVLQAGAAGAEGSGGGALGSRDGVAHGPEFRLAAFAGYAGGGLGELKAAFRRSYDESISQAAEAGGKGFRTIGGLSFAMLGAEVRAGASGHPIGFVVRLVSLLPATFEASCDWEAGAIRAHEESSAKLSLLAGLAGISATVRMAGFDVRCAALAGLASLAGTWRSAGTARVDLSPFGIFESSWESSFPVTGTGPIFAGEVEVAREVAPRLEAFLGAGYTGARISPVKVAKDTDSDHDGTIDVLGGTVAVRDADGNAVPFDLGGLRVRAGIAYRL